MAFVNLQMCLWSALRTLDNNNDVLTDLLPFFSCYTLLNTSFGLTGCISIVFSFLSILSHLTNVLPVGSLSLDSPPLPQLSINTL